MKTLITLVVLVVIFGGCRRVDGRCPPPEISDCKEKSEILYPDGNRYISCEYDGQTVEVVDKPMPGAAHAYWILKCACPKPKQAQLNGE